MSLKIGQNSISKIYTFDQSVLKIYRGSTEIYAGFSPLDLSPRLWHDASDASTIHLSDATHIEQWDDKSGNNDHAIQTILADQPEYDSVIKDVDFVNNATRFRIDVSSNPIWHQIDDFEIVIVFDTLTTPNPVYETMFNSGGANSPSEGTGTNLQIRLSKVIDNGALTQIDRNVDELSKFVYNVVVNETAEKHYNWINNANYLEAACNHTKNWGTANMPIGNHGSSDAGFGGRIYEHLIFERILTTTERNNLYTYLAAKWGIT